MRWKGIIFLIVTVVIVLVLGLIFSDEWFEARLEALGNAAVGARVEIDNLDLSLLGLHVRWDSLQVTHPRQTMENILTTGATEFKMQLVPLFSKNIIIENVQVINITSGTPRTTDGKLAKKKGDKKPTFVSKTMDRLQEQAGQAPAWNLDAMTKSVNVDSILKLLDLQTPQRIDSLSDELEHLYSKWDSTLTSDAWQSEYAQIDNKVQSIQPDKIKTVVQLEKTAETLKQVYDKIDSLKSFTLEAADSLQQDLSMTQRQVGRVDDWISRDMARALDKAKLPSISKENIGLFLFGPEIVKKVNSVLQITGQVRHYSAKLKSDQPKKEKPPRFKGQTIHFTARQVDPSLWIKRVKISGTAANGLLLDGQVNHIVSRQSLIGEPMTLSLQGRRADKAALTFSGEFNYLNEPRESISVNVMEMPFAGVVLSDSKWLPQNVTKGKGQVSARLVMQEQRIEGSLDFAGRNMAFGFDQAARDSWSELLQSVFVSADNIDIHANLVSDDASTEFKVRSNIDDFVVQQVRDRVGDQVMQARQEIEREITSRVDQERTKLNAMVDRQTRNLSSQMQTYTQEVERLESRLEEKRAQVLKRLESEKRKQTDKVKDKVKDLF
ncbi:MAG: TIGR03545 family protein [candidate division KSB1 bacterium]|nr:TIGR03545 family protein [candidate division KSB1 bacterium]